MNPNVLVEHPYQDFGSVVAFIYCVVAGVQEFKRSKGESLNNDIISMVDPHRTLNTNNEEILESLEKFKKSLQAELEGDILSLKIDLQEFIKEQLKQSEDNLLNRNRNPITDDKSSSGDLSVLDSISTAELMDYIKNRR